MVDCMRLANAWWRCQNSGTRPGGELEIPTYNFLCHACEREQEIVASISEYVRHPPALFCCSRRMERFISVAPAMALHNAIASERHYDGLTAPDGTPIDTRAKHRAYMKANNLTTADDFAGTWKKDAEQRAARLEGTDPTRAADVARAIAQLEG
jgi:hypothetical protein